MKMFKNHPSLRTEALRAAKGKRSNSTSPRYHQDCHGTTCLAITLRRILKSEAGYALSLALILLLFGGFFVVPCLNLLYASLNANIVVDERDLELYAADAGIDYGLWRLQYDDEMVLPVQGEDPLPLDFPETVVNDRTVTATIVNITVEGDEEESYKIESTALSADGDSTTIESRVEALPGENLAVFDYGLASETDITLGKSCNITGDMYYEGTFTYQEPLTHDGAEVQGGLEWPTQEEIDAFALTYKNEALAGGTHSGDYTIGIGDGVTITDLGPLYITGNLSIAKDNIINMQGTIYVERYIDVNQDSEFTGSGSIIAVGDISLAKMSDYGTEGDTVIMSLNGNITFKKEATMEALIYAPDGTVTFEKDAEVTGAVVANDIQVAKESTFTFESSGEGLQLPGYTHGWQVITYIIE